MRTRGFRIAVIIGASIPAFASAAEAPMPAKMFFRADEFAAPQLSPSGEQLGALTRHDSKRYALSLIDLKTGKARVVVKEPRLSAEWFAWKSDDRILVSSVNDGGYHLVHNVDLRTNKSTTTWGDIASLLRDDPNAMLVVDNTGGLCRIDLRSERVTVVEKLIWGVSNWVVDPAGTPWAGIGFREGKWVFIWRSAAAEAWRRREQTNLHDAEIYPMAIAPDRKRLVVIDRTAGPAGLAYFDLVTEALTPIFRDERVDVTEMTYWGFRDEPCAVVYHTDRLQRHFFLPEAEQFYRGIAVALPDQDFRVTGFTRNERRAVVWTTSDRNPGKYYLLDRDSGGMSLLGAALPALSSDKLQPSRPFEFKSRNGALLTGRITLPAGVERPPLVIHVGPGLPGVRARNRYDPVAQFFASRGFALARIHVRGTTGFGREFRRAGDLQLASGMIDDLEDGTAWIDAQGWADARRAALFGQGWGGLVALHAAVRGRFRALVNFGTPMVVRHQDLAQLSPSDREEQELVGMVGSSAAAIEYRKALDPLKAAARLPISSFHYYPRTPSGDQMVEDGRLLKPVLRKSGKPFVLEDPPPVTKDTDPAEDEGRRFEAVAEFLRKELATSG